MWTVLFNGEDHWFPLYRTKRQAERAARAYRRFWKKHRYTVGRATA